MASTYCAFLRKRSLLYSNAKPIQADVGSDRGPACGLFRWAKASAGSGDRRRRASSARGPSPTSFGVLGLTRARQSFLWPDKSGWRGGGEAIEDVLSECAPHPAHAPYLTHVCARATQVPATKGAAPEVLCAGERAAERGVAATARRRGRQQQRGWASARGRRRRHAWRTVSHAAARRTGTTGLGPRGMRVRYCPHGT